MKQFYKSINECEEELRCEIKNTANGGLHNDE